MQRVLEPLSEATGALLSPIHLREDEWLTLETDDRGRFVAQARRMHPFDPEKDVPSTRIRVAGRDFSSSPYAVPSNSAARTWAERIPERKTTGYGQWTFGATDFTVLVIASCWPKDRIIFLNQEAELRYEVLLARFATASKTLQTISAFKIAGTVPAMPRDFIEHPEFPLLPYQRVGLSAFLNREMAALFMEQGTGKTAVTVNRVCLEAARKRAGRFLGLPAGMYRVLIVCPKQLRANWEAEFGKFATVPGKVVSLRGGEVERVTSLIEVARDEKDCSWAAAIISYDSVVSTLRALKAFPWDLVVLDESHYVKNTRTARYKAVAALRDANVRQRMILSGTPITNTPMDLYAQLEFLADGMSGFSSFENFRSFHGVFRSVAASGGSVQRLIGIRGVPLLQERLARLSFAITKKEANLALPDKTYDIFEVQMTPRQREFYRMVRDELAIVLEEAMDNTLTVDHILTQLLRLSQITSGHVRWNADEEQGTPARVEQIDPDLNPKVAAVLEMLQSEGRDPNGKTIVWAVFVEDIKALDAALKKAGIDCVTFYGATSEHDREQAVWRFNNDPTCRVFIGNPATAGTGLNLLGYEPTADPPQNTYCDHEIFFSCNWSAVQRSQAEDRAHRKGTKSSVRITDVVVPGSIDEEIRARVVGKLQMALQIQDVREILKRVLSTELAGE
jgi:SNF2 family DNA or RNA helicase